MSIRTRAETTCVRNCHSRHMAGCVHKIGISSGPRNERSTRQGATWAVKQQCTEPSQRTRDYFLQSNHPTPVPMPHLISAVFGVQRLELVDDVLRGGQTTVATGVVRKTIAQVLGTAFPKVGIGTSDRNVDRSSARKKRTRKNRQEKTA